MGGFCLLMNHKGSSSSARSPPRKGRAQVGLCCGSGHERLPYTSQVCMHTHPPAHSLFSGFCPTPWNHRKSRWLAGLAHGSL